MWDRAGAGPLQELQCMMLLWNYPGAHDSAWNYPGAHYSGMVLHRNYITVNGATQVHTTAAWSYSGTTLVHAAVHGVTLELPWCTLQCMVLLWNYLGARYRDL